MPPPREIYRDLIYATAGSLTPVAVMCNLTYRCPLRCRHCYVSDPASGAEELTRDEYVALFDELVSLETLFLTFSGGEPAARPDFLDILAAARERSFAVRIFTGGAAFDEPLVKEVARLRPATVDISLHAATPGLHDDFAGVPGTWERAMATARRFRERDTPVILKMNLMNFNFHEIKDVYSLAKSIGAEFRYSPYVSATTAGGTEPLQLRMTDEQVEGYFRILKDWIPELSRAADACDEELEPGVRFNSRALSCVAGFNNCSIDPYGTVWPCVSLPITLGNLREHSFEEIWHGEETARLRKLPEVQVDECMGCDLDRYCFRCAAFSVLEEGDIAKASPEYCRVARAAKKMLPRPLR